MICSRCEFIAVLAIGALVPSTAMALDDARLNRQLMRLDMETRLEKTCDTEVMQQINREHKELSVDKVIAYTFDSPPLTRIPSLRQGPYFAAAEIGITLSSSA